MSASAPSTHPRWWAGLLPTAKQLGLWVVSITVVALVSAAIASHFTRQDNLDLAFKQQQMAEVQRFQGSASLLDTGLRAFNDALVDERKIDETRDAMRAAIAQHSSDTANSSNLFGDASTKYNQGLGKLRERLDEAKDPISAIPMEQQAVNLIEQRQIMVRQAVAKIEKMH